MDDQFEAMLLGMIDDFLASNADQDAFLRFKRGYREYYTLKTMQATKAVESRADVTLTDLVRGRAGLELDRLSDEQLPRDRRRFFTFVAERAEMTAEDLPPLTVEERRYGYVGLREFIDELATARRDYREQFSR